MEQIDVKLERNQVRENREKERGEKEEKEGKYDRITIEEHQGTMEDLSTSSSSQSEADNLKMLLETDKEKIKKDELIRIIQVDTGASYSLLKSKSLKELEDMVGKGREYNIIAKKVQLELSEANLAKLLDRIEELKKQGFSKAVTKRGEVISFKTIGQDYQKFFEDIKNKNEDNKLGVTWELVKVSKKYPIRIEDNKEVIDYEEEEEEEEKKRGERGEGKEKEDGKKQSWITDPAMGIVGRKTIISGDRKQKEMKVKEIRIIPSTKDPLSPPYSEDISINGIKYPSISMYVCVMLLASTGIRRDYQDGNLALQRGMGVASAFNIIKEKDRTFSVRGIHGKGIPGRIKGKFMSLNEAMEIYKKNFEDTIHKLKITFARVALDKKFSNNYYKDLLLTTGKLKLLWADPNDLVLGSGVGKRRGENFVGKYLMELREKFKASFPKLPPVNMDNLTDVILKDKFLNSWLQMRMKDMCKTVNMVQKEIRDRTEGKVEILDIVPFIKNTIDTIYQPCGALHVVLKDSDIKCIVKSVPDFIAISLKKCSGFQHPQEIKELRKSISSAEEKILNLESSKYGQPTKEVDLEQSRIFNQMQRKEFLEFQEKIKKLSPREIEGQIKELSDDYKIPRPQITPLSPWAGDPSMVLSNMFKAKQNIDRDEFEGISRRKPSKTILAQRARRIKEWKEERNKLRKKIELLSKTYVDNLRTVAYIYWEKMFIMLCSLISQLPQKPTSFDIKNIIVHAELLNSRGTVCNPNILENKNRNCILSALLNVMAGIEQIKSRQADNLPLSDADVSLATSIILNRSVKVKEGEYKEEKEEKEEKDFLEDLGLENINYIPREEKEEDLYMDREEEELPDYGLGEVDFSFNGRREEKKQKERKEQVNREVIEERLESIDAINASTKLNYPDVQKLISGLLNAVDFIESFSMLGRVKTNRVNFFASQR